MKKGILLLEMILSIAILSFVGIYFNLHISNLYTQNKNQHEINISLITLESTRIFIDKKLQNGYSINSFTLNGNTLYFEGNVLLLNVDYFNISSQNSKHKIDISINQNKVVEQWLL
ncbi:MAG: hypothetical protein M0P43_07310 [Arcobacteraceae bacterium]|jgi:hypothetical protein|nr:hypothetical protein [Arcobacteraceae bacterium]MDY0328377.1 hypothetical protein [Arcobacteraceae bacterium]